MSEWQDRNGKWLPWRHPSFEGRMDKRLYVKCPDGIPCEGVACKHCIFDNTFYRTVHPWTEEDVELFARDLIDRRKE